MSSFSSLALQLCSRSSFSRIVASRHSRPSGASDVRALRKCSRSAFNHFRSKTLRSHHRFGSKHMLPLDVWHVNCASARVSATAWASAPSEASKSSEASGVWAFQKRSKTPLSTARELLCVRNGKLSIAPEPLGVRKRMLLTAAEPLRRKRTQTADPSRCCRVRAPPLGCRLHAGPPFHVLPPLG